MINRLFIPKLYQDRRDKKILKHLRSIQIHEPRKHFLNEPIGIGRRKYEYQKHISNSQRSYSLKAEDNEFPFPKK